MVNINDFKILNEKSLYCFKLFENDIEKDFSKMSDVQKARFGFYFLMLSKICDLQDVSDIMPLITDMDFNSTVFGIRNEDCGVDAVYFDEENKVISIFNFKYRENFNKDKQQSLNESFLTTKFIQAILTENTGSLKGNLKNYADKIIDKFDGKDVWKLKLYIVSNEPKELSTNIPELSNLKELYDLEIISIGLEKISQMISLRPSAINAVLHVDRDDLFPFSEDNISSSKSYIIKIHANELLRITCDNPDYRNDYAMEDYSLLNNTNMDFGVLFDNVRGFVVRSKFNKNIVNTLKNEPSKFFMYNNGLTITAEDIVSDSTNGGKKFKLTINNFQIVNGGQTLRTIHEFKKSDSLNIDNYLANCQLLVRIFKTSKGIDVKNKIAEYTNSQNKISIIDLKSLASEQIQIEQYLSTKGIQYKRKSGDLGNITSNKYSKQISMERLGQILCANWGLPEKCSNQKKAIFEEYYEELFINNFDLTSLDSLIDSFYEIKQEYKKLEKFDYFDQKNFYIIYLRSLPNSCFKTTREKIEFLEKELHEFKVEDDRADSRKLIMMSFREKLKEDYLKHSK